MWAVFNFPVGFFAELFFFRIFRGFFRVGRKFPSNSGVQTSQRDGAFAESRLGDQHVDQHGFAFLGQFFGLGQRRFDFLVGAHKDPFSTETETQVMVLI